MRSKMAPVPIPNDPNPTPNPGGGTVDCLTAFKGDDGRAVGYPEDAVRKSNHEAFRGRKLLDILYEPNCIVLVFNREPLMAMRLYQTTLDVVLPEKPK